MMCLACEQQGLWLAYLQRRGLITPEGYLVEQPPFLADAGEPQPAQPAGEGGRTDSSGADTNANKITGDDPKAG
jgi:hypothetical protein